MASFRYSPSTPTKSLPPLPRDGNATLDLVGQAPMPADDAPLPGQSQNPNNPIVVLQNNRFAEGVMLNIFSSNCMGSTVTKLEHIAQTVQPTTPQSPSAGQPAPLEYGPGRASLVFSGNVLCENVMINISSPNCTGADFLEFADTGFRYMDIGLDWMTRFQHVSSFCESKSKSRRPVGNEWETRGGRRWMRCSLSMQRGHIPGSAFWWEVFSKTNWFLCCLLRESGALKTRQLWGKRVLS
ncbi:hypothetical protein DFH29DRAFT_875283 [Suillus ampliporus]|nr:hypothetical protein DFH29DRAFT_875283 [Suillus ampliporus]